MGLRVALIKILNIGDELLFNLGGKTISVKLTEKAGRQAVLRISADKSIGITTVGKDKIWLGTPT